MEIHAPDFDLEKTLNSGQVFHWTKIDNEFVGTIGDLAMAIAQRNDVIEARSSELDRLNRSSSQKLIERYFALDHPLAEICAALPNDCAMNAAKSFCRGLRLIRQPKWECLATFICSSMKQVAHIRQMSRALRERFGDARKIDPPSPRLRRDSAITVFTFPSAERIARSSEKELRECALGYRAKNLLATARLVANGEVDLEKMSILSDVDLREQLCALPGVGAKVANCVMLFAYERLRAFPIDVWIERTLREKYFARKRKVTAKRLREFAATYFGEHGGYAQQYLFHHARMNKGRDAALRRPAGAARRRYQNDKEKRVT
jgi:N-glycosylase/DNA lyase